MSVTRESLNHTQASKRLVEEGLEPRVAAPVKLDHLGDAHREAACIGLDVRDATRARDPRARRQHIADALGRAHQLVHMLRAAEAEARGSAA